MNFALYMLGVVLVVIALAYGAHLLGLNSTWIGIGVLLILGLGIMGAVSKTRRRDPS
jgi:uncharacterized membrane protein YdjX (TVP38/TMEM64 family)